MDGSAETTDRRMTYPDAGAAGRVGVFGSLADGSGDRWSDVDIGKWVYRLLRSIKGRRRGGPKGEGLAGDLAGLAAALEGATANTVAGGRRVGELGYRVMRMGEEVRDVAGGGTE